MSVSAAVRAAFHVGRDAAIMGAELLEALLPAQAIRCAMDRDFSRAVTAAGVSGQPCDEWLAEAEEGIEFWEPRIPQECDSSSPSPAVDATVVSDQDGGGVAPPTPPPSIPMTTTWALEIIHSVMNVGCALGQLDPEHPEGFPAVASSLRDFADLLDPQ